MAAGLVLFGTCIFAFFWYLYMYNTCTSVRLSVVLDVSATLPEPALSPTIADIEASDANTTRSGNATNRLERVITRSLSLV